LQGSTCQSRNTSATQSSASHYLCTNNCHQLVPVINLSNLLLKNLLILIMPSHRGCSQLSKESTQSNVCSSHKNMLMSSSQGSAKYFNTIC
jgi:hypothetical protein